MARRRSRKIQPAVKSLYFNVPSTGDANFAHSYIDLSLAASAMNRRFLRQGLNWAVGGFTFYNESTNASGGQVRVLKLPDSWSVANAWTKSFKLWQEMQDQVAENNESLRARYNDFKVYADSEMVNATIQASWYAMPGEILMPISGPSGTGGYVLKYGEWEYSDITIPNATAPGTAVDYALHMIGDDVATSKGMLQGYGLSRSRPQKEDPNAPGTTGWMTELFDVGEQLDEVQANFEDENDQPPYRVGTPDDGKVYIPGAKENLPNLEIHSALSFTGATQAAAFVKQQIGGTNAQLGLIKIEARGFDQSDRTEGAETSSGLFVQVHLVPGPHKGYMCQKMQDVN